MKNVIVVTAVIRKNYRTGMEFIDINSLSDNIIDGNHGAVQKTNRHYRFENLWCFQNPIVRTSKVVIGEVTAKQILNRRY